MNITELNSKLNYIRGIDDDFSHLLLAYLLVDDMLNDQQWVAAHLNFAALLETEINAFIDMCYEHDPMKKEMLNVVYKYKVKAREDYKHE
jgi:hypothetical protein